MIDWIEISRHFSAHKLLRDLVPPIKHLQLWSLIISSSINLLPFRIAQGSLELVATRNMWSGMQPVAVRGILSLDRGRQAAA